MNPNQFSANKSYNITNSSTTVLPGKQVLIAVIINTKGASSSTLKIYDSNATYGANAARLKATIDTTTAVQRIDYGIPCFDGIYIVSATGTPADITVIYADIA